MKILIDNEEVVSGKDFTITEEMLNTPSVILNNVYPKTWENDKDYISRFYYPKDYSKCKIIQGEEIDFEILGETIQEGTPTPDSPKPIINKTGTITETIGGLPYQFNLGNIELCKIGNYQDSIKKSTGKNLFDKNAVELGKIVSRTNGTLSDAANYNASDYIPMKENTTYTLTARNFNRWYSACYDENKNYIGYVENEATFTTISGTKYMRFSVYNNLMDTAMINEGSTALPYEPYGVGKWYVEKKTRHISLAVADMDNSDDYPGWRGVPYLHDDYPNKNTPKFPSTIQSNIGGGEYHYGLNTNATNSLLFLNKGTWGLTQTQWKTNYPNLVVELYYGLQTPYYEEITDPILLKQLNSVGKELIFCGVVKNSGKISLNPRYPHFCDLQILDFKMFLSEIILDFVIANKTVEEAIQQVTSFISSYGFVVGNIELNNPNEMIGAYSTKDKSPYDVFNYIADITQSRWTTRMVDQNTVAIDFYNPELMEQGTAIEYTTQWFEDNKIDDISYSYGTYDYRNKQIMTSDEVMANISSTESIYANGYQTQYNTEKKIGNVSSVTLNGISKTITTNENKELGQTADFYYTVGNNYIESETPLSAGDTIVIDYIAIVQGRQIITNSTEINRVANSTGRNGTLARYENRNDATTSDELQKIGQSYIKYKGTPEIKLNISTRNNIWEIGQKVEFNAPITELSTEYMVKRKDVKYIATIDTIFYTYELTSSFNSEREINYFDNQRAKNKGNIGDGEYIARNIDIEINSLIYFYDTEIVEN